MELAQRRPRDGAGTTELVRRRQRDGAGVTKIAATEDTTWLNRGAESIGTLNLDFRVKGKDSLLYFSNLGGKT